MQRRNNKNTIDGTPNTPPKHYTKLKIDSSTETRLHELAKNVDKTHSEVSESPTITFARYSRKYKTVKFDHFGSSPQQLGKGGSGSILAAKQTLFFAQQTPYAKTAARGIKRIATKAPTREKQETRRALVEREAKITQAEALALHMCPPAHGQDYSYLNMRNLQTDFSQGKNIQTFLAARLQLSNPLCSFLLCVDVAIQICEATKKLHKKYVHCDIKPENIMLFKDKNGDWQIQLIDFGLTKEIGELRGFSGTLHYIDPQLVLLLHHKTKDLRAPTHDHRQNIPTVPSEPKQDYYALAKALEEILLHTDSSAQHKKIQRIISNLSNKEKTLAYTINQLNELAAQTILPAYCNDLIRFIKLQNPSTPSEIYDLANKTSKITNYFDAKTFLCEITQLASTEINRHSKSFLRFHNRAQQQLLSLISSLATESHLNTHYWIREYKKLILFMSSANINSEGDYQFANTAFAAHCLNDTLATKEERRTIATKRRVR